MGLASSKFIINGSYSFNNSIVYVPPRESTNAVKNKGEEKILGMDQMDFTIMLIVVCGGGSVLLIGFGVCAYCWIKRRKQRAAAANSNRQSPSNKNNSNRP